MSYECSDCNRTFSTRQAIESHCNSMGHSRYECDVCENGRNFKNSDALEQVHHLQWSVFCSIDYDSQHQSAIHALCDACDEWFEDGDAREEVDTFHNKFQHFFITFSESITETFIEAPSAGSAWDPLWTGLPRNRWDEILLVVRSANILNNSKAYDCLVLSSLLLYMQGRFWHRWIVVSGMPLTPFCCPQNTSSKALPECACPWKLLLS